MKGDVKRNFSPWTGKSEVWVSSSSPCWFPLRCWSTRVRVVIRAASVRIRERVCGGRDFILRSRQRRRWLKRDKPNRLESANHGSIGDWSPTAFWGYPRGPESGLGDSPHEEGTGPNGQEEALPSNPSVNRTADHERD